MRRLAWFSPLPPSTSGIAAYSAELLPLVAARGHQIDTFTADSAREVVWRQRRTPYDLAIYQMGNASCHDYMWAYLFRYPGLVVLHDAQLHQARALWLTRRWRPRRQDYLAEFRASHPEASADIGELIAAGLGGSLYQHWPMIRLVIERARLTIVHNRRLMEQLRERHPGAKIECIGMGVGDPLPVTGNPDEARERARERMRQRLKLPAQATVIAAFGGVTPEKRVATVIQALSAIAGRHPHLHLVLVGETTTHYDVAADIARWGVGDRVHVTGFVPDDQLADHLLGADLCACLRWPTNRETSASWLRCLAAGRATIVTDLAHQGDVPTLDPRGWRVLDTLPRPTHARPPVAVAIDLLDEQHSLQVALERLAGDARLRASIGAAARMWWNDHHRLAPMAEIFDRAIEQAVSLAPGTAHLPPHLLADGRDRLRQMTDRIGVSEWIADILRD